MGVGMCSLVFQGSLRPSFLEGHLSGRSFKEGSLIGLKLRIRLYCRPANPRDLLVSTSQCRDPHMPHHLAWRSSLGIEPGPHVREANTDSAIPTSQLPALSRQILQSTKPKSDCTVTRQYSTDSDKSLVSNHMQQNYRCTTLAVNSPGIGMHWPPLCMQKA